MITPARSQVRVLVVEDSDVQRAHLVRFLQADGDIVVVGQAVDAAEAVAMTAELRPDVVSLDLHIPAGGGQHAIEQIMGHTPTPILVLSARVSDATSAPAIAALVGGALDAVPKPARWTPAAEADLRRRVRSLKGITVLRHPRAHLAARRSICPAPGGVRTAPRVVAIAASTGGPPALAQILGDLAGVQAPVLIVQHIHADFVEGLAAWMRRVAPMPVRLAVHGERAEPGVIYIGPGDLHLKIGPGLGLVLDADPPSTHRPSADELFMSVAEHVGRAAIGVVLTGMGDDGAKGLLAIRQQGGLTIAQDRDTSAVFGMPRAAQLAGAVARVLPVGEIASAVVDATREQRP